MTRPNPTYKVNERVYVPGIKLSAVVITCAWREDLDMYEYLVTLDGDNVSKVVPETALRKV